MCFMKSLKSWSSCVIHNITFHHSGEAESLLAQFLSMISVNYSFRVGSLRTEISGKGRI